MNSTQIVDNVFIFILAISVALFAGVVITMLYFVVRYDRRRNPVPENIEGNLFLEIIWVVIPLIIVLSMFFYGWKGFRFIRTSPPNAMQVKVTARMWQWSFEYENNRKSPELVVPAGRPVQLSITSVDVLHSLFIPAFRIKEDAVPGMQTHLWFLPDAPGEYSLLCSEYCGEGHSAMITKVKVIEAEEFQEWYQETMQSKAKKARPGAPDLLGAKGCLVCHSVDGTRKIGPTLKGIFMRKVTVVTSGKEREIVADEEYLRRSIMQPQSDIVKGFPPVMTPQKDNIAPEDLDIIVEYLEGLK